jgi:hypothetical protein
MLLHIFRMTDKRPDVLSVYTLLREAPAPLKPIVETHIGPALVASSHHGLRTAASAPIAFMIRSRRIVWPGKAVNTSCYQPRSPVLAFRIQVGHEGQPSGSTRS